MEFKGVTDDGCLNIAVPWEKGIQGTSRELKPGTSNAKSLDNGSTSQGQDSGYR